jgi:hypothetical protein
MSDVLYLVPELASFVSSSTPFWPTNCSPVIKGVQFKAEPAGWVCMKSHYDVTDCMLRPVLNKTSFKSQIYFDTWWTNMVTESRVNFLSRNKRHCPQDDFFRIILRVWIFHMCSVFQTFLHISVRWREIEWKSRSPFPPMFWFLRECKRPLCWYLLFLSAVSYKVVRKVTIWKDEGGNERR